MFVEQTLSDMLDSEPNDKQIQNMPRKNHFIYELHCFFFNIIRNHKLFHIRSCWFLWPFICITKLISPPHEAYVLIVDSFTISPCLNLCVLIPILKIRKGNIFSSFVRVFFWYYWIFPLTHFSHPNVDWCQ